MQAGRCVVPCCTSSTLVQSFPSGKFPVHLMTPIKTACLLAGVRARQEKVPFATCEDEGIVDAEVKPLVGKFWHSRNLVNRQMEIV